MSVEADDDRASTTIVTTAQVRAARFRLARFAERGERPDARTAKIAAVVLAEDQA